MRNSSRLNIPARFALVSLALVSARPSLAAENELAELRAHIRALEQKLLVLERRQELKDEAAAAAPPPVVVAGASGFSIAPADRKFQLSIRANLQADARFFLNDATNGNDTFLIRRLRPSFEGVIGERFGFRLMPDLAPSTFNLLDAYVTYTHAPELNLLVGKTKSPFDLERLVSQTDLLFIERGYPTSLGPNRDIGVQVFGDLAGGLVSYQLAWLNGARDNDTTITDTDDGKEIVARIFAHPFKNDPSSLLQGLGIGVAVSTGDKTTGAPNSYRTNAQQTFFSWRSTVVSNGKHERIEPQAYYYSGSLGLVGSWVASKQGLSNGPGTVTRDITTTAWYGAVHYVLTGEEASYRGVTPAAPFSWKDGTWGAFEAAVRYGEFNIDDDAFPVFANPATSASKASGTTLGINWYLNRNVKATINFEHTSFEGGLGNVVINENEKAIFTRVQLRY
ncbi:MAG: porin [Verrucomicrobiota bacterium]